METNSDTSQRQTVRYEPNEKPARSLAWGLGLQNSILSIAGIVITPAVVIQAASGGESYMAWAIFAALTISGLTTILQACRLGEIGSGYILLMGTSGTFIAACVMALKQGGPGMLATLVVISSLFQFALSSRLPFLRRIITPTVAGTVIMLISVTVMPIVFDLLKKVPEGTAPWKPMTISGVTLLCVVFIILRSASGMWRLWAPVIGAVVGCVLAAFLGLYDMGQVAEADWIGFPSIGWPGFDLDFDGVFWALLPAFVLVTLVGAVETIGDAIAIQKVSWRKPRAVDFRSVQGAVAADGVGNLLSGLVGTVPNTTYSSSISVTEITGVASRSVGVTTGAIFCYGCLSSQGPRFDIGNTGPCCGRISFRSHDDSLYGWPSYGRTRWNDEGKNLNRRCLVLAWRRISE